MTRTLLTGTAAVALLACMSAGLAQAPDRAPSGAPGQQMQRGAPTQPGASGAAPGQRMQEQGSKPGQPGASGYAPGQQGRDATSGQREGGREGAQRGGDRDGMTGQRDGTREGTETRREGQRESGRDTTTGQRDGAREGTETRREGQREGRRGAGETTGAATSVNITTEQRTRIRQHRSALASGRVTSVNFNLTVGTVVPRTVEIYTLPPAIVEIVPEYRGYHYILVEEEIVIIEPDTLRIVAIIEV